jgi:hypothetical protein
MNRRLVTLGLGLALVTVLARSGVAEEKTIATQRTKEVVVTLKNETGQWKPGKNAFVLELASAKDRTPLDGGKVAVNTTMPMPGMAPMQETATLAPDTGPGRYLGTIEFPDSGTRQVTVSWDGPAGKGSTKFPVPVR